MGKKKQIDYENMSEARLRSTYIERCRQQGVSAGSNIPKTKSKLIQTIMEKDILLAVSSTLDDGTDDYKRKSPILIAGCTT